MRNTDNVDKSGRVYSFSEWLDSYAERSTRGTYEMGTAAFLRCIYKSDAKSEELAPRYIKETKARKRDYFKDLVSFIAANSNRPPLTIRNQVAATRNFLLYCCNIDIGTMERRMLRGRMPKGTMGRTHKDDLDREKLRAILSHLDVRMKALILVLLSSGIRVGEALRLKLSNIDLNTYPVSVEVRGEYAKEGDFYQSFISSEAKEALVEWLKVRESYIADSAYRFNNLKDKAGHRLTRTAIAPPTEDTVFPFCYKNANWAFTDALKKAKLFSQDETTGIKSIRIHDLRKFFISELKTKVPSEVVEAMAGHLKGLQLAYTHYSKKQMADYYVKGESALLVLQDGAKLDLLTQQVDKRDRQFSELMETNTLLQGRLLQMEERVAHFLEEFQGFTKEDLMKFKEAVAEKRSDAEIQRF